MIILSYVTSECQQMTSFPTLPDLMTCSVPDYCTAIDCCVDIPFIRRFVNFYIDLDACTYELNIGIENFGRSISLLEYSWGLTKTISVKGVLFIR